MEENYPKANRTVQWRPNLAGGATFSKVEKLLLHSTETRGWPSYGSFAPHLTYNPWTHQWRQHMPLTRSATTLADPASTPVRENRDNIIQVEVVGYCDPKMATQYGYFINNIDDEAKKDLGEFALWLHQTAGLKIQSTVQWVPYPKSYGINASQRLSSSAFDAYQGILGHQHASGNDHGDPGNIDIAAILKYAQAIPWVWDGKSFPGADKFVLGATGPHIVFLNSMLTTIGWNGAKLGVSFNADSKAAVEWFQKAQGWSGSDADGFPGKVTWERLYARYLVVIKPAPKPPTPDAFVERIRLDPPGAGNFQCSAQNRKTGEWFVAHSRGRTDGGEDVVLYRFDKSGRYRDKMTLPKCSHVYGFGVMDDNVIWLTWDDTKGKDVVTFPYRANTTISKSKTKPVHTFSDGHTDISFSNTRYWAAIRYTNTPQKGYERYRRYRRNDILAGKNNKWGKDVNIKTSSTRVVQGFSLGNEFLYVLIGLAPHSAFRIEKWSFATGKKVGELKLVSTLGLKPGETAKVEPEGMDGSLFTIKAYEGDSRRMVVYELKNF